MKKISSKLSKIHPSIILISLFILGFAIGLFFIFNQAEKKAEKSVEKAQLELNEHIKEQGELFLKIMKFQEENKLGIDLTFLQKSKEELAFENYVLSIKLKKLEAKIEKLENKKRDK